MGFVIVSTAIGQNVLKNDKSVHLNNLKDDSRIIYYDKGKQFEINEYNGKYLFNDILDKVETLFIKADEGYLLFVTKELINKIKKQRAVEVIYIDPKKMIIRGKTEVFDREVFVSKLLLPLTGDFTKAGVVIFYGSPDYTEVVVNTKGKELRELIYKKILNYINSYK